MTIRSIAILTLCIAIALLTMPRAVESTLVKTGNELDIAIVGRGNFCLVERETADVHYTRYGSLSIDMNGQLAVGIRGSQFLIDPPIQIPTDWERIAFLADGRVQTLQAGYWQETGQLQLALFTPVPEFDDPLIANPHSDDNGPPLVTFPGQSSGFIQQGWIEQSPSDLENIAIRIFFAILAAVAACQFMSSNQKQQKAVNGVFAE